MRRALQAALGCAEHDGSAGLAPTSAAARGQAGLETLRLALLPSTEEHKPPAPQPFATLAPTAMA